MLEGICEGNRVLIDVELIPLKKYINEQKQSNNARKKPKRKMKKENEMKRKKWVDLK